MRNAIACRLPRAAPGVQPAAARASGARAARRRDARAPLPRARVVPPPLRLPPPARVRSVFLLLFRTFRFTRAFPSIYKHSYVIHVLHRNVCVSIYCLLDEYFLGIHLIFAALSALSYEFSWELAFIKSGFTGQLPKPFEGPPPNGSRLIPSNMNHLNLEEPTRYVCLGQSHTVPVYTVYISRNRNVLFS